MNNGTKRIIREMKKVAEPYEDIFDFKNILQKHLLVLSHAVSCIMFFKNPFIHPIFAEYL